MGILGIYIPIITYNARLVAKVKILIYRELEEMEDVFATGVYLFTDAFYYLRLISQAIKSESISSRVIRQIYYRCV